MSDRFAWRAWVSSQKCLPSGLKNDFCHFQEKVNLAALAKIKFFRYKLGCTDSRGHGILVRMCGTLLDHSANVVIFLNSRTVAELVYGKCFCIFFVCVYVRACTYVSLFVPMCCV